jgi:hypothetical protein
MGEIPDMMFYDTVRNWFSRELPKEKKDSRFAEKHDPAENVITDMNVRNTLRRHLGEVLNESQLFLLNGAIVDSLYNLPQSQVDYHATDHMPFDTMFFELMDAVPFKIRDGLEAPLKAILFGNVLNAAPEARALGDDAYEAFDIANNGETFYAGLFFEDMNIRDMPTTINVNIQGLRDGNREAEGMCAETGEDFSDQVNPQVYLNLMNLCLNIISYTNAHNVTIRSAERETRNIAAINRRRKKARKRQIRGLKPYNWIDIKEAELTPKEIKQRREHEWEMDYREIVRGHFQRYHTTNGLVRNWRDPFVRGPDDAPWKENRYRLLEKMLKRGTNY